ncbi:MAG: hypothetical protein ABSH34_36930, partial [Verrucomicrobiota bacterium]
KRRSRPVEQPGRKNAAIRANSSQKIMPEAKSQEPYEISGLSRRGTSATLGILTLFPPHFSASFAQDSAWVCV